MSAIIIDGKAIANNIREQLKETIIKEKLSPGLAVILVGNNPASKLYIKNKIAACKKIGINSFEYYLDENIKEKDLIKVIDQLNKDYRVDGILVQLPLPKQINTVNIINTIDPLKDVDGFTSTNFGKLITGQDCFIPCTPQGCLVLIKSVVEEIAGKNALVIGRSNIVGKPMSYLLLQNNCTVTMAHSYTNNLPELCSQADIVVAAIGKEKSIKGEWLKKGSIVIDVGINYDQNKKIIGDVDFNSALPYVKAISPVPGGAGPMTVTCLLKNTVKAFLLKKD